MKFSMPNAKWWVWFVGGLVVLTLVARRVPQVRDWVGLA